MSGPDKIGRMRYGFYDWACAAVTDPPTPAAVEAYFSERGLELTREHWRNLLRGELRQIAIETWCTICDYADVEFGAFFSYEPAGVPLRPFRRSARQPSQPAPTKEPFRGPPDLRELMQ